MAKEKPAPCPHCGSDNVEMRGVPHFGGEMQYNMACKDCGTSTRTHGKASAAYDHWNGKNHKSAKNDKADPDGDGDMHGGSGKAVYG